MKKLFLTLFALVMATASLWAYDFEADGIYYNVTDETNKTVEVTSGSYSGKITIPSSVAAYSVTSIGYAAFYYCSGLTEITIPSSITEIDSEAFNYCTGLTAVHITNLAKWCKIEFSDVSANPLYYAHNLYLNEVLVTDLVIPEGITIIKDDAFYNCTGLTSVTIPNSVTEIGRDAFEGCTGLTSVTIPESVTAIGDGAFSLCTGLTSVTIPNSVTEISDFTFFGCSGLTSVTIGNRVTEIGYRAFWKCKKLTEITIPESVTAIGSEAFYYCTGLTSVIIPNSVTSIGDYAFDGCKGLTEVSIPNSVTEIGSSAFSNCTGLISVAIGSGVTSIGSSAFYGCTKLEKIEVDNDNPNYSSQDGILYNKDKTEVIHIPQKIQGSVTIPNSITSIGNYVFSDCTGLTSITIPNSVTEIGSSAFSGCTKLAKIEVDSDNPNYSSQDGILYNKDKTRLILVPQGIQGHITIPNGVTEIDNGAFSRCSGVTEVTIPNSVTSIGEPAFYYCTSLTKIEVDANNPNYSSQDGILYNKDKTEFTHIPQAIQGSVTIPNSITSIPNRAFYNCSGLTSVTIGNSVTSIDVSAFERCTKLTKIEVDSDNPNYSSQNGMLYNKDKTEFIICPRGIRGSVIIPDGVTSIGNDAFYTCWYVTSITIPNSVTSIGESALVTSSTALKSIYVHNSVPPTADGNPFNSIIFSNVTLYVPTGSKSTYMTTAPWSSFLNIVESDALGVEDVLAESITVTVQGGAIVVNGLDEPIYIEVYNLQGQRVYSGYETTIPMNERGIYLVKIGNRVVKVVL